MTHRCRQTDDRVLARLSGEVTDPVWADEVEAARLAGCDGCSQRLEEAEAFSAEAFAAFSEIPFPLGGADRVLAAVAVEVAQGGGAARPETGSSEAEGLRETDDPTLAGPLTKVAGNVVQAPWASGWSAVLRIAAALLFTTSFVYLGVEGLRRAGPTPELARLDRKSVV